MNRLLVALSCVFVLVSGTEAQVQQPAQLNEPLQRWFVELRTPPLTDGGSATLIRNGRQSFRSAAQQAGATFRERFVFETLFNGISMDISATNLSKLSQLDIKGVYPVGTYSIPDTRTVEPALATALAMTGADIAQTELGLNGRGIRVGVIDTGIDYNHPDLGGGFGPGFRVAEGFDFVGDDFDGSNTPVPDSNPDDCEGHGTHVSGIVGANGAVKGVAPNVTFGAYKVFGCEGSSDSDIVIAAMERALADRMDIVNMSLGTSYLWPQSPDALAADRLVRKGIVVVAAIGNAGPTGLYATSSPSAGSRVIAVGSFDNTHSSLPYFTISPDNTKIGHAQAAGAPLAPTSGSFPMARTGTATSTADACAALPAGSLTGRVALIRRGTCSFYQKSINAQNAGAVGVVLYNNVPGRFSGTVVPPTEADPVVNIPVVSISNTEGVLIDGRLAAGAVTMTWTNQLASFPNSTGGLISSFSSWGPSPELDVKPEISAPGGFIRSTYPIEQGSYATLNGTSMASPHVAGAVALMLQANPRLSPKEVQSILQNTGDPHLWSGNPALGFLDHVHRQGGGMLDIPHAVEAKTSIEPSSLALGESQDGPSVETLHIENNSPATVTYTLSHTPAVSTGPNTFTPAVFTGFASVSFSQSTITIRAGRRDSVKVTITANPSLPDRSLYGGYIVATTGSGDTYRVPYTGFKGDYQSIPVLTPTPAGFPWLARLVGENFVNQPSGASFTMVGDDIAYIIAHLDHPSRRLTATVFDTATGRSKGRAFDFEYMPRNASPTGAFLFPWDGTVTHGRRTDTLPNGQYILELTVEKALGNDRNPLHTETWISPVITIARPVTTTMP